MENRFGFIREKVDIKILILFIMRRLNEPVDFEQLSDLTMCDDGINYFDFSECVDELVSSDHLYYNGEEYIITDKGRKNGEITESGIPYSVRLKAEKNVSRTNAVKARDAMISTSRELKRGGGFDVNLSLSDGVSEIFSVKLLAINEKQAESMENGFRKNAESVYNALMNKLID